MRRVSCSVYSKLEKNEAAVYRGVLHDLHSEDLVAFLIERCDDHGGLLWTHGGDRSQPRIHPILVAIQYLQHNLS